MAPSTRRRRIVPIALGVAMLAVVVAAGLTPNVGVVSAQAPAQYTSASSGVQPWVYGLIAGIAVAAALLLALVLMRRRRSPPPSAPPVQAWQEGPPSTGGPGAPPAPPPPGAAPAYLESPEDVGHAPPPVPPPVPAPKTGATGATVATGAAVGAPAGAATAEGEPDIDSLMAELDKISGEILKRAPKKGSGAGNGSSSPPPSDEGPGT